MASRIGAGSRVQSIVVMRHGDRLDDVKPLWQAHAARPWDPPLTNAGLVRAWTTGKRIRAATGFPIHRVVVSPFLRCLQTAAEVVRALCAIVDDQSELLALETSRDVVIDPSRVKVSIEYGLCEMLNSLAINPKLIPADQKWFPDNSELESILPAGTLDHSFESVYQQLPEWQESITEARNRYANVIKALADKYCDENLLLVTHGEGVGVSVSSFLEGTEVYEVEYCAFSYLQRSILAIPAHGFGAEDFKVLTQNGRTGVSYSLMMAGNYRLIDTA